MLGRSAGGDVQRTTSLPALYLRAGAAPHQTIMVRNAVDAYLARVTTDELSMLDAATKRPVCFFSRRTGEPVNLARVSNLRYISI
jgi:hypothetical protein